MEIPTAELVDRYTILLLKRQHGVAVADVELEAYRKACLNLEWKTLLTINSLMWDLEDLITEEKDLTKVGAFYLALRGLTKRRIEARNAIAKKCGQPLEEKSY